MQNHNSGTACTACIIIVNYNGGQALPECLRSVLKTLRPGDALIVVDNASTDGSAEAVRRDFPNVTMVCSDRNLGFAAGNNLGATRASTSHLIFLNPDTTVTRGWLESLVSPLQSGSVTGLATSKILLSDQPDRINTCGNSVHISGLTLCRGLGQGRSSFEHPEEVPAVSGASFAISRALFEELGGFDEDFFLYMEDTDLSLRARLAGWSCLLVPDSEVLHHYSFRLGPLKIFYQERNRYLMLLKIFKWRSLIALLPALMLAEIVTWGYSVMNRRSLEKVKAYYWIFSHWQLVLSKRRGAQRLRKSSDRQLLLSLGTSLDFAQASGGWPAKTAALVLNPLFRLARALVAALVWW
ncbi:MAG TPA: glycosyltransferase family 2 protein [Acidobacteriota bacterium]